MNQLSRSIYAEDSVAIEAGCGTIFSSSESTLVQTCHYPIPVLPSCTQRALIKNSKFLAHVKDPTWAEDEINVPIALMSTWDFIYRGLTAGTMEKHTDTVI